MSLSKPNDFYQNNTTLVGAIVKHIFGIQVSALRPTPKSTSFVCSNNNITSQWLDFIITRHFLYLKNCSSDSMRYQLNQFCQVLGFVSSLLLLRISILEGVYAWKLIIIWNEGIYQHLSLLILIISNQIKLLAGSE